MITHRNSATCALLYVIYLSHNNTRAITQYHDLYRIFFIHVFIEKVEKNTESMSTNIHDFKPSQAPVNERHIFAFKRSELRQYSVSCISLKTRRANDTLFFCAFHTTSRRDFRGNDMRLVTLPILHNTS